ncbi:MAG: protein kinase [Candidatus Thorarchaeota archaeon]
MVSHYRIVEKIGAGGMGEVYLAEDTKLNRQVALKFMPSHLASNGEMRSRFVREAQAAAKLDHPNIVPVHEVGEYSGQPFFAMAHVEGKSLRQVIKGGKLTVEQSINFTMQICEGLHKAHEAGVVHRDMKPGNILIDKEDRARIVDFGLATVSGEEKLTKTGSTLGTVGYMSPEQIEGKRVDRRSDLFSVGVILYEMLTGHRPFEGDNDAAISHSITTSTPEPIARYKSGTTGELQQIIDKALTKDPTLRYQHADGILSDLKRLTLSSAPARRKVTGVCMGAAVIVVIVGVLLFIRPWSGGTSSPEPESIMLAVLPFENLGSDEDGVFAEGITEEITSRLGMIRELGVISRTSAMRYKNTEKSLPVIARELGVDYILEGSVRWDNHGDRKYVRITPQLIDAAQNTHVWTEIYEAEFESVFEIQGSIASDIAAEMDLTLVDSVRKAMESPPTENAVAYNAYIRGLEYDRMPANNSGNIDRAILMYREAIKQDSNFALAWASLSFCQTRMFRLMQTSKSLLSDARTAAQRSLSINRHSGEGHLALGYYYFASSNIDSALREFDLAERYRPSLARIYDSRAMAIEAQQGFTDESLNQSLRAVRLDPFDGDLLTGIAGEYYYRREIDKFIEYIDRAIAISPDEPGGYMVKALFLTEAGCNLEEARELFNHPVVKSVGWSIKYAVEVEIASRNYDLALAMLDTCEYLVPRQKDYFRKKRAWVVWLKGDTVDSKVICDSLRIQFETALEKEDNYKEPIYVDLARCCAILGRTDEAVNYSQMAIDLVSDRRTRMLDRKADLARTYALVGQYDKAIDQLEEILAVPNKLGVPALKMHPEWDNLRDHPRFLALIEKYEQKHGT